MSLLRAFLLLVPITVALDALWLGVIAKQLYHQSLGPLLRLKDGALDPVWLSAALVYVCIPLGIAAFVLPRAEGSVWLAIGWGALFGFVLYGVYEFTNHALLKGWPMHVVAIDLVWGMVLCGVSAALAQAIMTWLGWK